MKRRVSRRRCLRTPTECGRREHGDSVLIGASSVAQIKEVRYVALRTRRRCSRSQNLDNLEKGPLPNEVVKALDAAWHRVKGQESVYFR
jgi:aflatoxin B1 aldehyde reductase